MQRNLIFKYFIFLAAPGGGLPRVVTNNPSLPNDWAQELGAPAGVLVSGAGRLSTSNRLPWTIPSLPNRAPCFVFTLFFCLCFVGY